MKVLYLLSGLTHYYNLILNKLNATPGIEIVDVVPKGDGSIGAGVFQTHENVKFRFYELEEKKILGKFAYFKGLPKILLQERPDIVVLDETYLKGLMMTASGPLLKTLGTKLVLKSIPFMLPSYPDAKELVRSQPSLLKKFRKLVNIEFRRLSFQLLDAHVNYIEDAYEIYGTYGFRPEQIFITYNSPDTDALFEARAAVEGAQPILPPNDYRLIHVGRLVEWKRVDMLIRVVGRLREKFPKAEALILGFGPQEAELKQLTRELGLEDAVKFIGGVYDPKVLGQYFLSSSIYVLAGMGGISINDAMCFGLPVVCSVCDGTEKMLVREGVNGRYFENGSEDDLFAKISEMFSDLPALKAMGRKSEQIIRDEINIHTVTGRYVNAFRAVLGESRT